MDHVENKLFLKMKANEDKANHRSPFNGILWPSNIKNYINPRILDIERNLNLFLNQFQKAYYLEGVVSGYVKEIKEKEIIINIGVLNAKEELNDTFNINYTYKHFFSISFTKTENLKVNAISIVYKSDLIYNINFEYPNLNQKTSFSGQLSLDNNTTEFDQNDFFQNNFFIEISGNLFEKNDNKLRNKVGNLLVNIFNFKKINAAFNNQYGIFSKDLIDQELEKLNYRFVAKDLIKSHTVKSYKTH